MAVIVQNPDTFMTTTAFSLYNTTRSVDLPAASGHYGIDKNVWDNLIQLTCTNIAALKIPVPPVNINTGKRNMTGLCIWASVVATKFFVMRNRLLDSRLVRVQKKGDGKGSDHYFVVANDGAQTIICDITCSQFTGAPDFLVGRLADIKGTAKKVIAMGGTLFDLYDAGASTKTFVL